VAPISEQEAVKQYLDSLGINAELHSRGFYYKVDSTGAGNSPVACSQISVSYVGWMTDGVIFDQQTSYQTELANLIDGWLQGLPLIKKGGAIHLYIPPSLGYGDQSIQTARKDSNGQLITIPASSILIFDIHLLDVQ
jgi:FKBP-type peptidyl-prolyl cis-trans isomerase FkpA